MVADGGFFTLYYDVDISDTTPHCSVTGRVDAVPG